MKKLFCLIFAIGLIVMLGGCSSDDDRMPVTAFGEFNTNQTATLDMLSVRGIVESTERRNIYTTLGFFIEHVYVEVGDYVTAGQILAILDTEDLVLMIAQQRVELEMLQNMVEIIPAQRAAELVALRHMSELAPNQQRAEIRSIREHNQNIIQESQRMFDEATANLENNTNMHILQAETALIAAELNLAAVRRNYEMAHSDYMTRNSPHVMGAESLVTSTRIEYETIQSNHNRLRLLYEAGGLSQNELRQSENALIHVRNAYNDARTNRANIIETERRTLEQLDIALDAAITTYQNARVMLETTRLAATQELEMLRSNITSAQIASNVESLEMAVNMASTEMATNLTTMENAINLELMELTAALERTQIALQLLERQMNDSVITSPISGTVTTVVAREGSIGTGLLFVIEDTNNLRVITRFREYDLAFIYTGMDVTIRADATGNVPHEGVIRRINPSANVASPIVEFEVEVSIVSQDTGLRIGMNTRIEVDLNGGEYAYVTGLDIYETDLNDWGYQYEDY